MKVGSFSSLVVKDASPPQEAEPLAEMPGKPSLTIGSDGVDVGPFVETTGSGTGERPGVIHNPDPGADEGNKPYPSPIFTPNTR